MSDIKTGSVVKLASGGPKMTVQFSEDALVHCVWFNEQNIMETAHFESVMLRVEK
jgi:uncharacterized protein YodC (DUF2158 family)